MRINIAPGEYRVTVAPDRQTEDRTVALFRNATLALVAGSMLAGFALALTTSIRTDAEGLGPMAWVIAALLTAASILRSENPRTADTVGTIAAAWGGALSGGFLALLGLRLHFPTMDLFLLHADRALHFDGVAFVAALVRQGQWLFSIMGSAYSFTMPIIALSMCALAASGRRVEAWRACLCFNGSLLTTCVIAVFTPAKGLALWAPHDLLAHLPDYAMVYFWPTFDSFYGDPAPMIGLRAITGVISFPSFHAAMGFIVVAMWRKNRFAAAIAAAWMTFMLLSAFAFGGHYLVDVLAGLAIAAAWFALSRQLETRLARLRPASAHA